MGAGRALVVKECKSLADSYSNLIFSFVLLRILKMKDREENTALEHVLSLCTFGDLSIPRQLVEQPL